MNQTSNKTYIRNTINFLGVLIDAVDERELYERMLDMVGAKQRKRASPVHGVPHKVMYVNAHCMMVSKKDKKYRAILNNADLVYADGVGVVLAEKLFGERLPCRVTATESITEFCKGFAQEGLSIYLLGAHADVLEKAANQLKQAVPSLDIVGIHHGYFSPDENDKIIRTIVNAKPDILLVGLGVPYQEKWIEKNAQPLNVPVIWSVGGLFDFLAGNWKRGPKFLTDRGLEWFFRLISNPTRLWKRYLIGNLQFAWYVINEKFSNVLSRS